MLTGASWVVFSELWFSKITASPFFPFQILISQTLIQNQSSPLCIHMFGTLFSYALFISKSRAVRFLLNGCLFCDLTAFSMHFWFTSQPSPAYICRQHCIITKALQFSVTIYCDQKPWWASQRDKQIFFHVSLSSDNVISSDLFFHYIFSLFISKKWELVYSKAKMKCNSWT